MRVHLCMLITKRDILILNKGPMQGLNDTKLTADGWYSIIFSKQVKWVCLSQHYNGSGSYLFVHEVKINQFRPKDFEITEHPLCSRKYSTDFPVANLKEPGPDQ